MPRPHFFGYGSLVNRATHDYRNTARATVRGWRRLWRHTSLREVAYLTVARSPGHEIDGLIAEVPDGDWAALDLREHAYDRLKLAPATVRHESTPASRIEIYRTKPGNDAPPDVRHPILMSYLDTVVTGYLEMFGHDGAGRFFLSTDGWDSPVLDDRADPIYPRAIAPKPRQRAYIESKLDDLGVVRIGHDR